MMTRPLWTRYPSPSQYPSRNPASSRDDVTTRGKVNAEVFARDPRSGTPSQRHNREPIARDTTRTRYRGISRARKPEGTRTASTRGFTAANASANIARYFAANSALFTTSVIRRPSCRLPSAATAPSTYPRA